MPVEPAEEGVAVAVILRGEELGWGWGFGFGLGFAAAGVPPRPAGGILADLTLSLIHI